MTGVRSVIDGLRVALLGILAAGTIFPVFAGSRVESSLLLQTSRLAGMRYYEAGQVWPELKEGDLLDLRREADNPYDSRAVQVYWHEHKLGYVPRLCNADVARLLDHGARLNGRIVSLSHARHRQLVFEIDEVLSP